jgi:hypothetical protein
VAAQQGSANVVMAPVLAMTIDRREHRLGDARVLPGPFCVSETLVRDFPEDQFCTWSAAGHSDLHYQ